MTISNARNVLPNYFALRNFPTFQQGYTVQEYSAQQLSDMPTLGMAHTANLKIDDGERRVWLERTGVADGEPFDNKITVERLLEGTWITVAEYPGGPIRPT